MAVAVFAPGVLGKASCQITCTSVMNGADACASSVSNWGTSGCTNNGATFTQVTANIAKCYGNLGCKDSGSINACNGVATGLSVSCGSCTAALVDCEDDKVCFPANATVQLSSGAHKTMAELQVGDKVLVGRGEFSEVYMFSHRMTAAEVQSEFVSIAASGADGVAQKIELTSNHYLYVNGQLSAAGIVKVGDKLTLGAGAQVEVTSVSRVWGKGLYNPHTMHGDIVVNGILTSTYTTTVHPTLAHAALWPVRALYSAGVDVVNHAFDKGSDLIAALPDGPERV
jgi:hypothetical protein